MVTDSRDAGFRPGPDDRWSGRSGPDDFEDIEPGRVHPDTLRRLDAFASLLDDRWRIPGTNYRVGLDGLIGMVPGIGDTASALIASYVVYEAYRLRVPPSLLVKMAGNIGADWLLGSIPVAGDLFDFAWKANRKNVRLLLDHLRTRT